VKRIAPAAVVKGPSACGQRHLGAAASPLEGRAETLAVPRLAVPPTVARRLRSSDESSTSRWLRATVTDLVKNRLGELAGLAADLGLALAPAGHAELLQAVTKRYVTCSRRPPARWRWSTRTVSAWSSPPPALAPSWLSACASRPVGGSPGGCSPPARPVELSDVARGPRLAPRCRRAHRLFATIDPGDAVEGSQQTSGYWRCLTVLVRRPRRRPRSAAGGVCPAGGPWRSSRHTRSPIWVRNASLPVDQSWPRVVMSWWRRRGAYVADQRCPGREIRALGRRSSSARGWSRRSSP